MNLSAPWDAVTPSLDGPVLVALANLTVPVSGRHVHRLIGVGSEAGTRNALNRLVDTGLVHRQLAGNAMMYAINRAHLAWPAVEILAALRTELWSRLRSEIESWMIRPRSAAVFGSAARGDGHNDSDIDLLLIRSRRTRPENETWQAQVAVLRDRVTGWTGNPCQIYDISLADLDDADVREGSLAESWRRDAITVYGTELRQVLLGSAIRAHA